MKIFDSPYSLTCSKQEKYLLLYLEEKNRALRVTHIMFFPRRELQSLISRLKVKFNDLFLFFTFGYFYKLF